MALTYGCIVPHSPNLVAEVSERSRAAETTRIAMGELGIEIAARKPDVTIVISPHGPCLVEAFGVWDADILSGSMERFQAPEVQISLSSDRKVAAAIVDVAERMDLPVGLMDGNWELDRGVTVPSIYLFRPQTNIVCVATTMLGRDEHWLFGTAIATAARNMKRDVAIVASANLSHRVSPTSPHGYHRAGPEFDSRVRQAVAEGKLSTLLDIPLDVTRDASECGYAPLLVLGGAFDATAVVGRELSYECPFGIGYLVAEIKLANALQQPVRELVAAVGRTSYA